MKTRLLALLMIAVMMFSMASCFGGPKPMLDFDDAKKNLEDAEYTVNVVDEEDKLSVGVAKRLTATKMDEDGDDADYLYLTEYKDAKFAKLVYQAAKEQYDSAVKSLKLEIEEIEFVLENYKDDLKSDEIDEYEDELKDLQKELKEYEEEYLFGIKGNVVWFGTLKAVEDSQE